MNFYTSLYELDRLSGETLAAVEESRKLYDQEGMADTRISDVLAGVDENLSELRSALEEIVAANIVHDFDENFSVGKARTVHVAQFHAGRRCNAFREAPMPCS